MRIFSNRPRPALLAGLLLCASAVSAAAQDPSSPGTPVAQGPLRIERVTSGPLIAPDVRFTEVNGEFANLVGAYAGWITDNTLLVGGGGYWLTNGSDTLEMAYGGFVIEWLARTDRLFGFGARGLVGGGSATVGTTLGELYGDDIRFGTREAAHGSRGRFPHPGPVWTSDTEVIVEDVFFIAEPQANLLLNFSDRLRLTVGVGYRLIGGAGELDDLLRGATGSIALQWGGGSSR
jgi:hypothetical protein